MASEHAHHVGGANVGTIADMPAFLADVFLRDGGSAETIAESVTAFVELADTGLQQLRLAAPELLGSSGLFLTHRWDQGSSWGSRSRTTGWVSTTGLVRMQPRHQPATLHAARSSFASRLDQTQRKCQVICGG